MGRKPHLAGDELGSARIKGEGSKSGVIEMQLHSRGISPEAS
jgi:hypothetical protein